MSIFGKQLKMLRIEKKMTQKDLAQRLKVSESAIGMYERGEREPSLDQINKIASLLGVKPSFLIDDNAKHTQAVAEESATYEANTEREQLLEELEQYGNLAFEGGGEDLSDEELREIVQAMRDAAKTTARNTYNVINKYKK